MQPAANDVLNYYNALFDGRKQAILNAPDTLSVTGTAYYVSSAGCDDNDGCSPQTPWKTLEKVSAAELMRGDGVFFRRGDLFRGSVKARPGVTYAAYGSGDKPKLYGSEFSFADPALWEEFDAERHIWRCTQKVPDSGTLVFNAGEACAVKLIPSYRNGRFVCRDDETRAFDIRNEMRCDLELYWHFDEVTTTQPSAGESSPVPDVTDARGQLYLRCDRGNPGKVFNSIESLARTHLFAVGDADHVTIDNLCVKYVGMHGVAAAGHSVSLHVTNCEFGWIGGTIQHYFGTDPNYPQGGRGTVTRFGNAVEVYGGCEDYIASNNYIYEVYDAGITHQFTAAQKVTMTGIRYTDNVIENCVYGIEYFLEIAEGGEESCMDGVVMEGNFIRLSGYGWGQQRHNKHTPALIKGWSFTNTARNYRIRNNILDRSAYRMLHLVAQKEEYCPQMEGNIYIQHAGGMIGQYGANGIAEPELLLFDENAEEKLRNVFGDRSARVYTV